MPPKKRVTSKAPHRNPRLVNPALFAVSKSTVPRMNSYFALAIVNNGFIATVRV